MTHDDKEPQNDFWKEFLEILSIPFVRSVAEGFYGNIRRATSLVQMPSVLFSFMEVDNYFFRSFESSVQEHWVPGSGCQTFMQKYYAEQPNFKVTEHQPDLGERIKKRFDRTFANPSYGPFLHTSMQVLYSAAISASWTALECLAADTLGNLIERTTPAPRADRDRFSRSARTW